MGHTPTGFIADDRVVAEFLVFGSMPLDPLGLQWRPSRMSPPFGIALHGWNQAFVTRDVAIGIPAFRFLGTSPLTPGVHARHQQHRQAELKARWG